MALCLPVFPEDVPDTLRPPKGAQLALVVFDDLQCPECGQVAPLLSQASRTYRIPLVRHDFPLPPAVHNWALDAAVLARYFDTHSTELGNEFRSSVFQHQREITSTLALRRFADKFAKAHKMGLPIEVDPDGKLEALVKADEDLGMSLHLNHIPTIYILSNKQGGGAYVEVPDSEQLDSMIDAMK